MQVAGALIIRIISVLIKGFLVIFVLRQLAGHPLQEAAFGNQLARQNILFRNLRVEHLTGTTQCRCHILLEAAPLPVIADVKSPVLADLHIRIGNIVPPIQQQVMGKGLAVIV